MEKPESDTKSSSNIPASFPTFRVAAAGVILLASLFALFVGLPQAMAGLGPQITSIALRLTIYTLIVMAASMWAAYYHRQEGSKVSRVVLIISAALAIAGISSLVLALFGFLFYHVVGLEIVAGWHILSSIAWHFLVSIVSQIIVAYLITWLTLPLYRYYLQETLLKTSLAGVFVLIALYLNPAALMFLL